MKPPSEPSAATTIVRRPAAKNPNISHGPAVVLYNTSKTRIEFKPFYIKHTDHTELAVKLTKYTKDSNPDDWNDSPQKEETNLKEPAARILLEALQNHLAVAQSDHDGKHIVIPLSGGPTTFGEHEPIQIAAALMTALGQPDIVAHLRTTELSNELVGALKGSIRFKEMRAAVAELRSLLDTGESREERYQDWCERHSWAFWNTYLPRDTVRTIAAGDNLDLLLPTVIAGFRDIIELKRPDHDLIHYDRSHNSYYFAADVSKAIGQCHRYMDVLHDVAARGLRDHPEIVAYHPRATIIIGRSHDWDQYQLRALHGLNRRLVGLVVMSYDQLLAQGERLLKILNPSDLAEDGASRSPSHEDLDDIEFATIT